MKDLLKSRKFRQGSMASALIVIVVAVVVLLNAIATTLTDRYFLSLDLTPNRVFSITSETKAYLAGLDKDVLIRVLDREESFVGNGDFYLQAVEVLKKYAQESDHIELEFVDLVANPALAQQYPSFQLSSSSILIVCGDKVRDVAIYDLYDYQEDMYGRGEYSSQAEQVLTSAILAVTSENSVRVANLTGHGEEDISTFWSLLGNNNYILGEVNTLTETVDSLYDVAIIAAPSRDYTEDELRALDSFLRNDGKYGKTLLYLPSADTVDLPNLDAFFADWGIEVGTGLVYESDSGRYAVEYTMANPYIAVVDYAEASYAQDIQAAGLIPFAGYARPLSILFETKNGISTSTLLQFAGSAGIAQDPETILEPTGETIPFLVMSRYLGFEGDEALQSQVLVFGSSVFVDAGLLANPSFANSDYMLNLLASLTGKEDGVRIQSKSLSASSMPISALQALVIGAIVTAVIPLGVLISGIVTWARRRHL